MVRITRRAGKTAPGYIFLAPFSPKGSPRPDGPLITDNRGDLVWFKPVRRGTAVTDLKVQQLDGRPVITWWEGRFAVGWGYGAYKVLDSSYRQVASISLKNGYQADLHDLQLTDRGTALLLAYDRVRRDLRRVGGPRDGIVVDNIVQEVDLKTGLVLFEWHSLGPVPLEESRSRPEGPRSWDYFHVNSVEEDTDGNLIVSARNTCTLYKLNRADGSIMWRLGGAKSSFRMGRGTHFCFQHDARRSRPGEISLFDNSAGPPFLRKRSRAVRLRVDERSKRVSLRSAFVHPGILAPNQGSTRVQPNGNVFVGWGAAPVFSEFSSSGRLLLDGRLTRGKGNYRAVRAQWTGSPTTPPSIAARAHQARPHAGLRQLERRHRGRALAGARRTRRRAPARHRLDGPHRVRDRRSRRRRARRVSRSGRSTAAAGCSGPPRRSGPARSRVAPARDHAARRASAASTSSRGRCWRRCPSSATCAPGCCTCSSATRRRR